jgi:F420-non-reducing hydrogenase iron-sulfur subunit
LARVGATKTVLEIQGIDAERFAIEWVSSAEAPRFAELVNRFIGRIRELGPNPQRPARAQAA